MIKANYTPAEILNFSNLAGSIGNFNSASAFLALAGALGNVGLNVNARQLVINLTHDVDVNVDITDDHLGRIYRAIGGVFHTLADNILDECASTEVYR